MKMFIGTKLVRATVMNRAEYNSYRNWDLPVDEDGTDEGYLVEYLDGGKPNHENHTGYISWSPKEQFDNAYRATTGLSFGLAVEALKKGHKVSREGWNGNKRPPSVPKYPKHTPNERLEIVGDYAYLLGSKGSVAVIDADSIGLLQGKDRFTEGTGGYFTTSFYVNGNQVNKKLHQLLMEAPDGYVVDHINGDILDNRFVNLRLVTHQMNNVNRSPKSGQYKGVSFDNSRDKWIASIQIDGKTKHLGRFSDEKEAAIVYDRAAYKAHGEFVKLNFPDLSLPPRMFLFLVPGSTFKVNRAPLLGIYPEGTEINYQPHIDMKTAQGTVVPWLASQSDVLADDWRIVGES